jgi:hypothetical protein
MATLAELWGEAPAAPAPVRAAGFPVVTPEVQRTRDAGRQRILGQELAQNQAALASATTPEARQLAQLNIDSLNREMGGRTSAPVSAPITMATPAGNTLADLWESTPATAAPKAAAAAAVPTAKSEEQQLAEAQTGMAVNPMIARQGEKIRQRVQDTGWTTEKLSVGDLAKKILQPAAALTDIAIGAVPAAVGQVAYQIARPLTTNIINGPATPERAQEIQKKITEPYQNVIGRAFGITQEPGYTGEATTRLMNFVNENVSKGAQWISEKTGAPLSDVENMMQTASLAVPGGARAGAKLATQAGKGAVEFVQDVATTRQQLADQFAQKRAPAVVEGQPSTGMVSAGAAAAPNEAIISQALSVATPELRESIKNIPVNKVNVPTLQRHIEADSLPIPVRLTEGQATGDIVKLSNEQNRRGQDPALAQRFNEQNNQLVENLGAIRETAAPDVYGTKTIENSQSIIDAYKKIDDAKNTDIRTAYKALEDANGGQFPVDGKTLANNADNLLSKKLKTEFLPSSIRSQLERFKTGEQMTFEQFEAMRTNLAAEIRKAERSGDGNAAMASSLVRQALEDLPMPEGAAANLKAIADNARNLAKQRFDMLKKDPAYKAAVDDTVPADKFMNKFVINGVNKNIKTMADHLGRNSEAHQHMAAGTINWLKDKAGIVDETGNFSQAGYNRALKQLDATNNLNEIFNTEAKTHLKSLGNVARYTQAQPRGAFVNNSNTLVGALAERAKQLTGKVAEQGLNLAVPYMQLGTSLMEMRARRAAAAESKKALEVGAGTKLKDIGK